MAVSSRKTTLFLAVLLSVFAGLSTANAQRLQGKLGGGFATHFSDAQLIGAFKAGLGVEFEIDQHFTLSPALLVYGKGWKNKNQTVYVYDEDKNLVYDEAGQPLTVVKQRSTSANYLELQVLANYFFYLPRNYYFYVSGGPYAAYGLSGKQKTKGDGEAEEADKLYYESKTFKEQGVRRFDAGLTLGCGVQFPSHLMLGVESDLGLLKFNDNGDRNLTLILSLTYEF